MTAWQVRAGVLAPCLLALWMGVAGITDEGDVILQGDMPRYLMNGVYFLDLVRDRPLSSLSAFVEYTRLYYARYPALSLGQHPLLLPLLEAPFYALFGVSVFSARLAVLLAFVAAVAFLYLLVKNIYDPIAALIAAALFATSPFVVMSARSVMSEMPTLALVIACAYYLERFLMTQNRQSLVGFTVTAVLSLYAKQLAIFVFPAFFFTALASLGLQRLLKRDVVLAVSAFALLTLPLVPITLVLSRTNVAAITHPRIGHPGVGAVVYWSLQSQLTLPVLLLALAGAVGAVAARDRRSLLFLVWLASVFAGLQVAGRFDPPRYSIYWVPALCTLAASVETGWRSKVTRRVVVAVLLIALWLQGAAARETHLVRAEGYEEAARFVLQANPGPTVLFSGDVDSGFFTFFVRKHDAARRLVVLRADKLLTTSLLGRVSVEERIGQPDEVYGILHEFGTRYVVIEDRPSASRVLEWLREELRSARFVERARIPLGTSDPRLRGTSLVVYEFKDATPADKDAILSLHLPIITQSVTVKLSDLINRKALR